MYQGFGVLLLALGALSAVISRRVHPDGAAADQVRGFLLVGALASAAVGIAVEVIGVGWDPRIADGVAIVALFALVAYYLAALVVWRWLRSATAARAERTS